MMRHCVSLAAAAALSGCGMIQPERVRWAEQSVPLEQTVIPVLSLSSTAAQPPASTKVKDLPERAAAAYIAAIAAKTKTADEFRAAIAGNLAPAKVADGDLSRLPRTIAISLGREGFEDGQRFIGIDVVIVPIGFEFTDYTQLTSIYESINLETVSLQTTTDAKIDLAPKFGHVVEAVDASYEQGTANGTTYSNQGKIEILTPDFQRSHLGLRLHSAANEDLTGTILVSASVHPSGTAQSYSDQLKELRIAPGALDLVPGDQVDIMTVVGDAKLTDDTGHELAPAKASITTVTDKVWKPRTLYACAALRYRERVPRGDSQRFYDEGKQVISEREFVQEGHLYPLVDADEVAPPLWGIFAANGYAISVETATKPQALTFTDDIAASRFAYWLTRTHAYAVGGKRLYASKDGVTAPLPRDGVTGVIVQRIFFDRNAGGSAKDGPASATTGCTIPGMTPTAQGLLAPRGARPSSTGGE